MISGDSIDWVSCSIVSVVVSIDVLICLLFSLFGGKTLVAPYSTTHGRFDCLGVATFLIVGPFFVFFNDCAWLVVVIWGNDL